MYRTLIMTFVACLPLSFVIAQTTDTNVKMLSFRQKALVNIAAATAKGDLTLLQTNLSTALDSGLTVNEAKEALVHTYAYCGFPRSIRGLQTLMLVLDERKKKGMIDNTGRSATPISDSANKYIRGAKILGELTGSPQSAPRSGYGAFSPTIDTFLKEHLFADIFERDVLSYAERELVTVSVLITLGGVEPMLQSHMGISLRLGIRPEQLSEAIVLAAIAAGEEQAIVARKILDQLTGSR